MSVITINLPYPPSVNSYWRRVQGRTIISRKGRLYRTAVSREVNWQRLNKRLDCRLDVEMVLHPPDKRRRDIDNTIKATLDALQSAGVFIDDSQVDRLLIERGVIEKGGRAVIKIKKWMVRD